MQGSRTRGLQVGKDLPLLQELQTCMKGWPVGPAVCSGGSFSGDGEGQETWDRLQPVRVDGDRDAGFKEAI